MVTSRVNADRGLVWAAVARKVLASGLAKVWLLFLVRGEGHGVALGARGAKRENGRRDRIGW